MLLTTLSSGHAQQSGYDDAPTHPVIYMDLVGPHILPAHVCAPLFK